MSTSPLSSAPASPDDAPLDVIVIGAGPAGLAASAHLALVSDRTLLVDAGPSLAERDRYAARSLTVGVGGAGLFSDGKFSFYPAASSLWALDNPRALRAAYEHVRARLARHGLPVPPWPAAATGTPAVGPGRWVRKDYEAHYLSLEARAELTAELFALSARPGRHRLGTRAMLLPASPEGLPAVRLDGPDGVQVVQARHVVLAGGRFFPQQRAAGAWPTVFRRLEFGVRIVDQASAPFFAHLTGVDPKLRFVSAGGDLEWRTFCMCRRGEVVATETDGLLTASGRADGPPSEVSSVGLLARALDERLAERLAAPLLAAARREPALFAVSLGAALTGDADALLAARLGPAGAAVVLEGVRLLVAERRELLTTTATLVGPSIEGVGLYPQVDDRLRVGPPGVWAAGDCAGVFRGLVAALVSGVYVAGQISEQMVASRGSER